MIKELIIADDFTGGLDTGVMFAEKGFATWMADDQRRLCECDEDCVAVMDTETRHLKREDALENVRKIAEFARKQKIPILFKKTDSLLRGNIGAELEGMIQGSGRKLVVFVPAYPKMGRTINEGKLLIQGKLLTDTNYADDLISPVNKNRVKDIIRAQTTVPVREIGCLNGISGVAANPEIYICDTVGEKDLRLIAEAVKPVADQVILAGCGGFAKYVAEYLTGLYIEQKKQVFYPKAECGEQTVFCGSVNERTQEQVKYAAEKGIFLYKLRPEEYLEEESLEKTGQHLVDLQRQKKTLLICTALKNEDIYCASVYAKRHGILQEELYERIACGLGRIAAICMQEADKREFSVVGGDTLYRTMDAAGYKTIQPVALLQEGAVLSKVYWKKGNTSFVVSKAGSFGSRVAIWKMFQKENQEERGVKKEEQINEKGNIDL